MCMTVELTRPIFYSLNCCIRIIFTSCYCVFSQPSIKAVYSS